MVYVSMYASEVQYEVECTHFYSLFAKQKVHSVEGGGGGRGGGGGGGVERQTRKRVGSIKN